MSEDQVTEDANQSAALQQKRNRTVGVIILIFILIAIAVIATWFVYYRNFESTNDAYVEGNLVVVSARQDGAVIGYYVNEANFVKEGEVLVELDPIDHYADFELKRAALVIAARQVLTQYEEQHQKEEASPAHRHPKVHLHPLILKAKTELIQAYLALKRCTILAPATGYVAKRNVQVGQTIRSSSPLLTIAPLDNIWIIANFKETQLEKVRIGQPVKLHSDFYGSSVVYDGKIAGMLPGTGSVFSLLPAQNASGNWIKIVQRVPVRITLDADQIKKHPLIFGLSMSATVDISDTSGLLLANKTEIEPAKTTIFDVDLKPLKNLIKAILKENLSKNTLRK